nr:MAG TPA: hypothetical protein [Caudoviricetes sp.]
MFRVLPLGVALTLLSETCHSANQPTYLDSLLSRLEIIGPEKARI